MRDDIIWAQKYRPKKVEDCILPTYIKDAFQDYVKKGEIPNLLLSGAPGVGKTTAILAACDEIGLDYLFINSSSDNGIDVVRSTITNYASTLSLSGGRKVIILDEFDGSSPNMQKAINSTLEQFSKNCTFVFTCNFKNKIIQAIHSRCGEIHFKVNREEKPKLMVQLLKRVLWILDQENVTYDKAVVSELVTKYYPDNRKFLNELQLISSRGPIAAGSLSNVSDVKLAPVIKSLKSKNFADIRKWLSENDDLDSDILYRRVYNTAYDYLKPNSIPQLVLLIAKYQYQNAFVADSYINTLAFFTEMMIELDFL